MPVKDARQQLGGISPTTFYALVKQGELSLVKIGPRSFVQAEELDDFVRRKGYDPSARTEAAGGEHVSRTPSSQVEPLTQASVLVRLIHGWRVYRIRITHPWEFIQPAPEAVRPRLLDWQVDAKGRHVAWRYRITRYEQDGQPRWWLDGTGQHPWTSDDVEYLKDVAEHHAGRLLRRQRWRPKSMYNGQEPPLWIGGRGWSS